MSVNFDRLHLIKFLAFVQKVTSQYPNPESIVVQPNYEYLLDKEISKAKLDEILGLEADDLKLSLDAASEYLWQNEDAFDNEEISYVVWKRERNHAIAEIMETWQNCCGIERAPSDVIEKIDTCFKNTFNII